jgi:excisionase family DNA binding protein
MAVIFKLIDQKVLAEYARAQQALLQEVAREAAEQARGLCPLGNGEQLLTAKELAEQLKVPLSWVYEQSRQGNIPTHRVGRYLRFRLSEVLAIQQERQGERPH